MDIEGDAFGKIYEYFLGKFAMSEGAKRGQFFTPLSIVKLIVEIIEPFHGRIYDPACGSVGH
jgi:type I restriction enzyme M protein